jgi:energy-coupling factor transport system ATP-binding protein
MIRLDNISFKYAGSEAFALRDINISVGAGEFVGVIGPAGAGKSTLAQALSGVVPHVRRGDFYGAAWVDGSDTVNTTPAELARSVGCVFQDVESQFATTMVEDEILYALENFSVPREDMPERVNQALLDMGIGDLRERSLFSLSGGQKQKVALAAVMALAPKLLVLDEPTGELDPKSSVQVLRLLQLMRERRGTTIVIVEQKIMLLCEFADRLIVMDKGRVALDGPVRELLNQPDQLLELGVNCPRVTSLAARMKARGWTNREPPINIPEAERMVREAIS